MWIYFLAATSSVELNPLRCFIVPQKSWFPCSLCGTVSRAPTHITQRNTNPHPSFPRPNYNYEITLTNKQHTHIIGACTYIVRTWGDITSWNNKPESIKGLGKQLFSRKYFSYKDLQYSGKKTMRWLCVFCRCIKKRKEIKSLLRERQKVPLGPSGDLAPVKSISVTPAHRLDMELFHSHDWAADIYPQSHRVMEPVCPSCAAIVWPFTSCLPDPGDSRGESRYQTSFTVWPAGDESYCQDFKVICVTLQSFRTIFFLSFKRG